MRLLILILALGLCLATADAQLVQTAPSVVATATATLGVAATSITVSVPSGAPTNNLIVTFMGRKDGTNAGGTVGVRFNGDTGANYDSTKGYLFASGTIGSDGVSYVGQTSGILGDAGTLSSALANAADVIRIEVPFYANTTFFKSALSHRARDVSVEFLDSILWHSTAAITSVTIVTATDNWIAGSKLTLIFE